MATAPRATASVVMHPAAVALSRPLPAAAPLAAVADQPPAPTVNSASESAATPASAEEAVEVAEGVATEVQTPQVANSEEALTMVVSRAPATLPLPAHVPAPATSPEVAAAFVSPPASVPATAPVPLLALAPSVDLSLASSSSSLKLSDNAARVPSFTPAAVQSPNAVHLPALEPPALTPTPPIVPETPVFYSSPEPAPAVTHATLLRAPASVSSVPVAVDWRGGQADAVPGEVPLEHLRPGDAVFVSCFPAEAYIPAVVVRAGAGVDGLPGGGVEVCIVAEHAHDGVDAALVNGTVPPRITVQPLSGAGNGASRASHRVLLRPAAVSGGIAAARTGFEHLDALPAGHEAALLWSLRARYRAGHRYSALGPVLIALSPSTPPVKTAANGWSSDFDTYEDASHSPAEMRRYREAGARADSASLPPHVFAVAEAALASLQQLHSSAGARVAKVAGSHSLTTPLPGPVIVHCGEGGAGKSLAVRHVLRYLAAAASSVALTQADAAAAMAGVIDTVDDYAKPSIASTAVPAARLLAALPALEAFVSVATRACANSTRAAVIVRALYAAPGARGAVPALVGGAITVSALETARVVAQAQGERSFHIFYQLAAGAPPALADLLQLRPAEHYAALTGGGRIDPHADVLDDAHAFGATCAALAAAGVGAESQLSLWRALAGLLSLGNVRFEACPGGDAAAVSLACEPALAAAARQLGLPPSLLRASLLGSGSHTQASAAREALSRSVYLRLVSSLVVEINAALAPVSTSATAAISVAELGGLDDRAAHEPGAVNSLEQLLANLAAEKSAQLFASEALRAEMAAYAAEQVTAGTAGGALPADSALLNASPFTAIAELRETLAAAQFSSSSDLLERRPLGLCALAEEEALLGARGSEAALLIKFKATLARAAPTLFTAGVDGARVFTVRHFGVGCGVKYTVDGFLARNAEELPAAAAEALRGSADPRLASYGGGGMHRTASQRASEDLGTVIAGLQTAAATACQPLRFIWCLRASRRLGVTADVFDSCVVLDQIRAAALPAALALRRAGWPVRLQLATAAERFAPLLPLTVRPGVAAAAASLMGEGKCSLRPSALASPAGTPPLRSMPASLPQPPSALADARNDKTIAASAIFTRQAPRLASPKRAQRQAAASRRPCASAAALTQSSLADLLHGLLKKHLALAPHAGSAAPHRFAVGRSCVFFRAGVLEALDGVVLALMRAATKVIASSWKRTSARVRWVRARAGVKRLQAAARRHAWARSPAGAAAVSVLARRAANRNLRRTFLAAEALIEAAEAALHALPRELLPLAERHPGLLATRPLALQLRTKVAQLVAVQSADDASEASVAALAPTVAAAAAAAAAWNDWATARPGLASLCRAYEARESAMEQVRALRSHLVPSLALGARFGLLPAAAVARQLRSLEERRRRDEAAAFDAAAAAPVAAALSASSPAFFQQLPLPPQSRACSAEAESRELLLELVKAAVGADDEPAAGGAATISPDAAFALSSALDDWHAAVAAVAAASVACAESTALSAELWPKAATAAMRRATVSARAAVTWVSALRLRARAVTAAVRNAAAAVAVAASDVSTAAARAASAGVVEWPMVAAALAAARTALGDATRATSIAEAAHSAGDADLRVVLAPALAAAASDEAPLPPVPSVLPYISDAAHAIEAAVLRDFASATAPLAAAAALAGERVVAAIAAAAREATLAARFDEEVSTSCTRLSVVLREMQLAAAEATASSAAAAAATHAPVRASPAPTLRTLDVHGFIDAPPVVPISPAPRPFDVFLSKSESGRSGSGSSQLPGWQSPQSLPPPTVHVRDALTSYLSETPESPLPALGDGIGSARAWAAATLDRFGMTASLSAGAHGTILAALAALAMAAASLRDARSWRVREQLEAARRPHGAAASAPVTVVDAWPAAEEAMSNLRSAVAAAVAAGRAQAKRTSDEAILRVAAATRATSAVELLDAAAADAAAAIEPHSMVLSPSGASSTAWRVAHAGARHTAWGIPLAARRTPLLDDIGTAAEVAETVRANAANADEDVASVTAAAEAVHARASTLRHAAAAALARHDALTVVRARLRGSLLDLLDRMARVQAFATVSGLPLLPPLRNAVATVAAAKTSAAIPSISRCAPPYVSHFAAMRAFRAAARCLLHGEGEGKEHPALRREFSPPEATSGSDMQILLLRSELTVEADGAWVSDPELVAATAAGEAALLLDGGSNVKGTSAGPDCDAEEAATAAGERLLHLCERRLALLESALSAVATERRACDEVRSAGTIALRGAATRLQGLAAEVGGIAAATEPGDSFVAQLRMNLAASQDAVSSTLAVLATHGDGAAAALAAVGRSSTHAQQETSVAPPLPSGEVAYDFAPKELEERVGAALARVDQLSAAVRGAADRRLRATLLRQQVDAYAAARNAEEAVIAREAAARSVAARKDALARLAAQHGLLTSVLLRRERAGLPADAAPLDALVAAAEVALEHAAACSAAASGDVACDGEAAAAVDAAVVRVAMCADAVSRLITDRAALAGRLDTVRGCILLLARLVAGAPALRGLADEAAFASAAVTQRSTVAPPPLTVSVNAITLRHDDSTGASVVLTDPAEVAFLRHISRRMLAEPVDAEDGGDIVVGVDGDSEYDVDANDDDSNDDSGGLAQAARVPILRLPASADETRLTPREVARALRRAGAGAPPASRAPAIVAELRAARAAKFAKLRAGVRPSPYFARLLGGAAAPAHAGLVALARTHEDEAEGARLSAAALIADVRSASPPILPDACRRVLADAERLRMLAGAALVHSLEAASALDCQLRIGLTTEVLALQSDVASLWAEMEQQAQTTGAAMAPAQRTLPSQQSQDTGSLHCNAALSSLPVQLNTEWPRWCALAHALLPPRTRKLQPHKGEGAVTSADAAQFVDVGFGSATAALDDHLAAVDVSARMGKPSPSFTEIGASQEAPLSAVTSLRGVGAVVEGDPLSWALSQLAENLRSGGEAAEAADEALTTLRDGAMQRLVGLVAARRHRIAMAKARQLHSSLASRAAVLLAKVREAHAAGELVASARLRTAMAAADDAQAACALELRRIDAEADEDAAANSIATATTQRKEVVKSLGSTSATLHSKTASAAILGRGESLRSSGGEEAWRRSSSSPALSLSPAPYASPLQQALFTMQQAMADSSPEKGALGGEASARQVLPSSPGSLVNASCAAAIECMVCAIISFAVAVRALHRTFAAEHALSRSMVAAETAVAQRAERGRLMKAAANAAATAEAQRRSRLVRASPTQPASPIAAPFPLVQRSVLDMEGPVVLASNVAAAGVSDADDLTALDGDDPNRPGGEGSFLASVNEPPKNTHEAFLDCLPPPPSSAAAASHRAQPISAITSGPASALASNGMKAFAGNGALARSALAAGADAATTMSSISRQREKIEAEIAALEAEAEIALDGQKGFIDSSVDLIADASVTDDDDGASADLTTSVGGGELVGASTLDLAQRLMDETEDEAQERASSVAATAGARMRAVPMHKHFPSLSQQLLPPFCVPDEQVESGSGGGLSESCVTSAVTATSRASVAAVAAAQELLSRLDARQAERAASTIAQSLARISPPHSRLPQPRVRTPTLSSTGRITLPTPFTPASVLHATSMSTLAPTSTEKAVGREFLAGRFVNSGIKNMDDTESRIGVSRRLPHAALAAADFGAGLARESLRLSGNLQPLKLVRTAADPVVIKYDSSRPSSSAIMAAAVAARHASPVTEPAAFRIAVPREPLREQPFVAVASRASGSAAQRAESGTPLEHALHLNSQSGADGIDTGITAALARTALEGDGLRSMQAVRPA